MTITESFERNLLSLCPYIKCPIKLFVIVIQIDMFLLDKWIDVGVDAYIDK